ncbi:hypothetical protein ZWY2020_057888 [Hordeum vulgare]|nr:hypothetical protein ZWY2020_057888 [Hordeum vulgare]
MSSASEGGPVQLRMRLPKAQVAAYGRELDAAEAAAKIMQLCAANRAVTPERSPRFLPTADWGTGGLAQTPERSPRFMPTPDWGAGGFAQTPERSPR